jgi:hypothetical protein
MTPMLQNYLHMLTSAFGALLLLCILAAGILMMFAPQRAKELLKNAAVSLGLFVLGTMLLQSFCGSQRLFTP